MIRGTVTLDAEQVSTRIFRISNRKVDKETGYTDLRMNFVAESSDCSRHFGLKVTLIISASRPADVENSSLRIVQKRLQRGGATRFG